RICRPPSRGTKLASNDATFNAGAPIADRRVGGRQGAQWRRFGGEGGIRTHGTVARTPHFECGTIDHSATSPTAYLSKGSGLNKGGRSPPLPWPFLGRLLGPLPALPYWEPAKPAFRTMSPQRTI